MTLASPTLSECNSEFGIPNDWFWNVPNGIEICSKKARKIDILKEHHFNCVVNSILWFILVCVRHSADIFKLVSNRIGDRGWRDRRVSNRMKKSSSMASISEKRPSAWSRFDHSLVFASVHRRARDRRCGPALGEGCKRDLAGSIPLTECVDGKGPSGADHDAIRRSHEQVSLCR